MINDLARASLMEGENTLALVHDLAISELNAKSPNDQSVEQVSRPVIVASPPVSLTSKASSLTPELSMRPSERMVDKSDPLARIRAVDEFLTAAIETVI